MAKEKRVWFEFRKILRIPIATRGHRTQRMHSAQGGGALGIASFITQVYSTGVNNIAVTSNNTSGQAHATVSPFILVTVYLKL